MNKSPLNALMVQNSSLNLFPSILSPAETDARFRLTEDLLDAEREFLVSLRTIYDIYARPLRKLCSISDEEQKQLFGGVEPVLSVSNMLLTKVLYLWLICSSNLLADVRKCVSSIKLWA